MQHQRGWRFGSREHMLPVFKIHFKKILKLQKIRTKSSVRASRHSICSWSRFKRKTDISCVVCKKTNFDANKRLFTRRFFCLFYTGNKKYRFPRNLLCTHITSRCTRHIFFQKNFHFQNVFQLVGTYSEFRNELMRSTIQFRWAAGSN